MHGLCQAVLVSSGLARTQDVLGRFAALRQHQRSVQRSPHKPLLVLLALGQLAATGSSALPWSVAEPLLADLIAEFGRPSRTGRAQSAAYPLTRLRADRVWVLDHDVQDLVAPLADGNVVGQFERSQFASSYPPLTRDRSKKPATAITGPSVRAWEGVRRLAYEPRSCRWPWKSSSWWLARRGGCRYRACRMGTTAVRCR